MSRTRQRLPGNSRMVAANGPTSPPPVRAFDTGADRDTDEHKIDPEGALSPLVLDRFCQYMLKHSVRLDGSKRSSDNWQKGMPVTSYMKSGLRHMFHAWQIHRGWVAVEPSTGDIVEMEDALCGVLFNVQGALHVLLSRYHVRYPQHQDQQSAGGSD